MKQTVWPTEVIISDDGSTDETKKVITDFLNHHDDFSELVTVIDNNTGEHGVVPNFENALHYAQGDYVFFL